MTTNKRVTVLVVDDSSLCRQLICDALAKDPDIEVIGQAANGEEAIARALELNPAVITMDVDMPVLDGLTATERIMGENPVPILVLTADPRKEAPALTHRALSVGALALQVKPSLDAGPEAWNLAREVKLLSTVKVIRHVRGVKKSNVPVSSPSQAAFGPSAVGVIAIAASTGGPQVLQRVLGELPAELPVPIVVAQHISQAFSDSLVSWIQGSSKLKVRVAKDGDLLTPGTVLIAPPDAHLTIPSRGRVAVKPGPSKDGQVPSGTLLLESAATAYGRRAVGVILTGIGTDGVDGIAAIRAQGGVTIAQSQDSAIVFGMPGAAISRGVVDHVVHTDELARVLLRLVRGETSTAPR
jgi:two-component system chemotaxis response regulator CheB